MIERRRKKKEEEEKKKEKRNPPKLIIKPWKSMKKSKVMMETKFAKDRFRSPVAMEMQINVVEVLKRRRTAMKNPYLSTPFWRLVIK